MYAKVLVVYFAFDAIPTDNITLSGFESKTMRNEQCFFLGKMPIKTSLA